MKVIVLGAGIIGVSTAWYLLEQGHEVTVVDRQPDAALETSFANGAQISVSFCEPWAHPSAPLKVLKWLLRDDSPLLFRPKLDPHQWRWGLSFLTQCTDAAFERNVAQLVALGRYSHESLKSLVAQTGIEYDRLERGILHFFSQPARLRRRRRRRRADAPPRRRPPRAVARRGAAGRARAGAPSARSIAGGTYTASDESGDARVFTQQLARAVPAARRDASCYEHDILGFDAPVAAMQRVRVRRPAQPASAAALRGRRVRGRHGHASPRRCCARSASTSTSTRPRATRPRCKLKQPERASVVSMIDDTRKIAISRLGDTIRVAGTAEMAGYDTGARQRDLTRALPGAGAPLRRAVPRRGRHQRAQLLGRPAPEHADQHPLHRPQQLANLWVNAGHGTLGWTHGAGSGRALAELMSGVQPALDFGFCGGDAGHALARGHRLSAIVSVAAAGGDLVAVGLVARDRLLQVGVLGARQECRPCRARPGAARPSPGRPSSGRARPSTRACRGAAGRCAAPRCSSCSAAASRASSPCGGCSPSGCSSRRWRCR